MVSINTSSSGLTLDKKLSGQYRRLFQNLGLLMLVILTLTASTVVYFDKKQVENLSGQLITSTTTTVVEQLTSFFQTADSNLRIAIEQLQMAPEPDGALMKNLFFHLSPFLNQHPYANGIIVAKVDADNEYFGILRSKPTEFLVRIGSPEKWGRDKARLEQWQNGEMVESWIRKDDFDIASRPWYGDALEAGENEIVTTAPYVFYPVDKPGITISTRWRRPGTNQQFIMAIDILLSSITRFTQTMHPTENGLAFVFTSDHRFVGLPADKRFNDESAANAALLQNINEVNIPILQASLDEWKKRGSTRKAFSFKFDGQAWWAGYAYNEDDPEHLRFWSGILVPESDFLGALSLQRNVTLAAIIGLGLLSALILAVFSVRRTRHEVKQAVSQIGRILGPFELLYKIGDGGNGTVYRARHALLKRPTAIKVMLPQFASSESAKQRFINEVQMTSSLAHPNTVAVFDFGQTPEGTLYYAMVHLSGVTLEELVRFSGAMAANRALRVLHQVCGSLSEAHGQGMIHRDIKPTNIMLCEHGGLHDVVKVLDFGLVKDVQQVAHELTQENALVGTPFYMAPELITDASAFSPSSDLYALGGVGYYLLTGHNVFEGASAVEICAMHLHHPPVPPSERSGREIPSDLEMILMSCLAKDPRDRPPNAHAMAEMLARCAGFNHWSQRRAQQWWAENRSTLPLDKHEHTHSPLGDTHLLLDTTGRTGD